MTTIMSNTKLKGRAHTYRGHRRKSFVTSDLPELVEFRARQRTFHGAYSRTALGNLGYSLTILRLFDRKFYKIGLLFAILAGLLFVLAFLRSRHSNHDFADQLEVSSSPPARDVSMREEQEDEDGSEDREDTVGSDGACPDEGQEEHVTNAKDVSESSKGKDKDTSESSMGKHLDQDSTAARATCSREKRKRKYAENVCTSGTENTRVFGRPFVTAGWMVIAVSGVVAAVEIGLLVLIFQV